MMFGLLNAVGLFIIINYSFNSYADGLRLTIAANLDANSLCAYTNIYPPRNLVIFTTYIVSLFTVPHPLGRESITSLDLSLKILMTF